jgi:hypothetical protein
VEKPVDNAAEPSLQWSPAPGLVGIAWVVGVAFATVAVVPDLVDLQGRLLAGLAAAALLIAAAFGSLARPRLAADADGLQIRGVTGTHRYPWAWVQRVHVVRTRRFGREIPTLEIEITDPDGNERLLVFGRLELNADPVDVSRQLNRRAGSRSR